MKNPELEIIIVNYNSEFWLSKTLDTLKEFYLDKTSTLVQVSVVDNGSGDGSLKKLKKEYPWTHVTALNQNRGYAAANNKALEKSHASFVMLLNSDVELTPDSNLDLLLSYLKSHTKVAAITPRLEFTDGNLDWACHRGEPNLWASFTYFLQLEKLFPKSKTFAQYHLGYLDTTTHHAIDACSGAAMMIRSRAIKKVGLLDERFFMYAEDLDWCKRFREAGYKIWFEPKVKLIHHKYKSGIKQSSQTLAKQTKKHFYDTMLQYYDKHYQENYPRFVRGIIHVFIVIKKGAL